MITRIRIDAIGDSISEVETNLNNALKSIATGEWVMDEYDEASLRSHWPYDENRDLPTNDLKNFRLGFGIDEMVIERKGEWIGSNDDGHYFQYKGRMNLEVNWCIGSMTPERLAELQEAEDKLRETSKAQLAQA